MTDLIRLAYRSSVCPMSINVHVKPIPFSVLYCANVKWQKGGNQIKDKKQKTKNTTQNYLKTYLTSHWVRVHCACKRQTSELNRKKTRRKCIFMKRKGKEKKQKLKMRENVNCMNWYHDLRVFEFNTEQQ